MKPVIGCLVLAALIVAVAWLIGFVVSEGDSGKIACIGIGIIVLTWAVAVALGALEVAAFVLWCFN